MELERQQREAEEETQSVASTATSRFWQWTANIGASIGGRRVGGGGGAGGGGGGAEQQQISES